MTEKPEVGAVYYYYDRDDGKLYYVCINDSGAMSQLKSNLEFDTIEWYMRYNQYYYKTPVKMNRVERDGKVYFVHR